MKKRPGTYEEWKVMGDEIKAIRDQLVKFLVNPEYQALLTKQEQGSINRAIDQVDKFKNAAENRMFRVESRDESRKWLHVFYGQDR